MLVDVISRDDFSSIYSQMTSFEKNRFRNWYGAIVNARALGDRDQPLAENFFDQNFLSGE